MAGVFSPPVVREVSGGFSTCFCAPCLGEQPLAVINMIDSVTVTATAADICFGEGQFVKVISESCRNFRKQILPELHAVKQIVWIAGYQARRMDEPLQPASNRVVQNYKKYTTHAVRQGLAAHALITGFDECCSFFPVPVLPSLPVFSKSQDR